MASAGGSFGDLVRHHRTLAGMSQELLAERAGLTANGIGALERGARTRPHPHTIHVIAEALSLTIAERTALVEAASGKRAGSTGADQLLKSTGFPIPPSPLIGREQAVRDVSALLRPEGARLVTLTGPGGVGKTRLALALAAERQSAFVGGVAFVALAAVQDAALVLPTIASALGVRETGGSPLADRLGHALGGGRFLLVLDNLEHLAEAGAAIADLLATYPDLAVLATSRATLRLRGEHEYPVPPLETPTGGHPAALEELAANDAVALFVQRAGAVRPDFRLSQANAQAVAGICARLDGLPLAIELAAARIKVLSPEAMLARLETDLSLLAGGPRDQAPRLQSMRAAIAWSYDLLSSDEQALFRRLAVFAGGISLEAAEAVAASGVDQLSTTVVSNLDVIASLLDKSLLRRLDADNSEPRFGMLETIREYGLEQLASAGDEAAARGAHTAYFVDLAEQAWRTFRNRTGHEAWLDRLEAERGNIRAALVWLDELGDAKLLLRLTGTLYWMWYVRGPISEGRSWLERALAAQVEDAPPFTRARATIGAALLAHAQGDDELARAWLEANLAQCRELDDPLLLELTLLALGMVAEDRGEYHLAKTRFAVALVVCRAADDRGNAALAVLHLGIVAWGEGDVARAVEQFEEAIGLQREEGEAWGLSISLAYLGLIASECGEHARAAIVHRESLKLRWGARAWEEVTGSLFDLATLAAAAERPERAARLFGAAEASLNDLGRMLKLPERAAYERAQARARSALGQPAYAEVHAAGLELSRDQAVAEALALADEIALPDAVPKPGAPRDDEQ